MYAVNCRILLLADVFFCAILSLFKNWASVRLILKMLAVHLNASDETALPYQ